MIVQVCGSWRPKPESQWYEIACQLGKAVTKAGHTILTGGYGGIMEAASRGAVKAGGQPIGVTCPELDKIIKPNKWIRQLCKTNSYLERLCKCFELSDAAIFLPGRSGTASEVAVAAEMRKKGLLKVPLVLYGNFWVGYFEWLEKTIKNLQEPKDEVHFTSHVIVSEVNEAVNYINRGDI